MRVYISGPMTGYPDYNFPAFREAAEEFRSLGFEVEDPSEKGVVPGWTWEQYLAYDLRVMLDCDAIYLLDGWEDSRGSRLECHVAKQLGFKRVSADGTVMDLADSLGFVDGVLV